MSALSASSFAVENWSTFAPAVAAIGVGFAGSGHCAGMCGSMVRLAQGDSPSTPTLISYQIGRLLTYSLLGGVIGAMGGELLSSLRPSVSLAAIGLLSLGSIWSAFRMIRPTSSHSYLNTILHRVSSLFFASKQRSPLLRSFSFGVGTAFLPCGFLWGFLIASAASAGFLSGAGILFAFGLGTVPALGVFHWISKHLERRLSPKISATLWLILSLSSFAAQAGLFPKKHLDHPVNHPTQNESSENVTHTHCH